MAINRSDTNGSMLDRYPVLDLAFRPFFLLAAVFSIICLGIWAAYLNGVSTALVFRHMAPTVWHLHEMLFGFAALCAMGFLLTAVQTWTGLRSAHGILLLMLVLLWLSARIALWVNASALALLFQGSWWLLCIGVFSQCLLRASSRRNYQFIPVLLCLMAFDLGILILAFGGHNALALHLGRSAILVFAVLVTVVGGRIIPLFTRNATQSARIKTRHWLERLVLCFTLLSAALYLVGPGGLSHDILAACCLVTGGLHLYRLAGWDSIACRSNALLWSLHASYFCLALGYLLFGVSLLGWLVTSADALHLIAVGAMGGMILSVICRVSLGHTGRPLVTPVTIRMAFGLILLSALVRILLPVMGSYHLGWNLSAGLWCLAYGLFVWHYLPILLGKRVDSRS
ncbi:MAG: NnrS family protein [Oleiphilus sp.]|nr:MAG: NnrS family protein [Oleiphilus sp.]